MYKYISMSFSNYVLNQRINNLQNEINNLPIPSNIPTLNGNNNFTGYCDFSQIPTTETATTGDNSDKIATTEFVETAINNIVNPDLLVLDNTFIGTNDFTNQVSFSVPPHSEPPLLGNDLATKGYVDSLVGQYSGGYNLFLNYSQPVVVGGNNYFSLSKNVSSAPQQSLVIPTVNGEHLLVSFITDELNISEIPTGLWNLLLYGAVSGTANIIFYHFHLKKYSAGIITTLSLSGNSLDVNATPSNNPDIYHMNATISTAEPMLLTDRIIIEVYYTKNTGSSVNLTTYFENAYYSFIQSTLNAGTTLLTSNNNWTANNNFVLSPTVPTVISSDNSTKVASTGFVNTALSDIVAIVAPDNSTTLNVVNKVIIENSISNPTQSSIILDAINNPTISTIFNNLAGETNNLNLKSIGSGVYINSVCTLGLRPIQYLHNGIEYMKAYNVSNNTYLEVGSNGGVKFLTFGGASTVINANDALSFSLPSNTTAHTKTPNNNSTQVSTTAYVDTAITNIVYPFVGTASSNLNMNGFNITSPSALTIGNLDINTNLEGVVNVKNDLIVGSGAATVRLFGGDGGDIFDTTTENNIQLRLAGNPRNQIYNAVIPITATAGGIIILPTALNGYYVYIINGSNFDWYIKPQIGEFIAQGLGQGGVGNPSSGILAKAFQTFGFVQLVSAVSYNLIVNEAINGTDASFPSIRCPIMDTGNVLNSVNIGGTIANRVNIGRVGQQVILLGDTLVNYLEATSYLKTPTITALTTSGALTIAGDQIVGGTVGIGSSVSTTTLNGIVKIPNLSTNNFIYRKSPGTQILNNNSSTTILFTDLISSANSVGITYNIASGVFTNTNTSTVICKISYTLAYPANATGVRNVQLFSSTLGVSGISEIAATTNIATILNGSTIISVPFNGTFSITAFQNSGVNLTVNNRTSIQILVL